MIFKISLLAISLLFTSCQAKEKLTLKKIANIPEASGVCYSKKSDTLFVVGDEGRVYELSKDGKIVKKAYLGKYNFEGIACDDETSSLYAVVEGKDNIVLIDKRSFRVQSKINIKRTYKGKLILKKDWKKRGLEGITLDNSSIYLSNQSKKFLPKEDPSVIIKIDKKKRKKAKIKELIDPHIKDISGLDIHNSILYMVTDRHNLLILYDLSKKKILKRIKLPKFAVEGIAFDDDGFIYFADDNGHIFKTTHKVHHP